MDCDLVISDDTGEDRRETGAHFEEQLRVELS